MSEPTSGEEQIDEQGRNPTQRRIDAETGGSPARGGTNDEPHEGEEGQVDDAA